MNDRIPGWAYWLERAYGEKVPQCPRCKSEDLFENFRRASYDCRGCGWELDQRAVRMVPQDERVRRPEEASA